ncbi:unnamed protein product [Eruca vesicaria subsp. sativa]|uniref:Secreted protein n=1 Tax=Eruca vesicaria subsp. sativa TaxID=29727 RepID=A0ABC8KRI1_ERUVS|nr:unnamed protein product [Eruca vesicaria subsp. sativa]
MYVFPCLLHSLVMSATGTEPISTKTTPVQIDASTKGPNSSKNPGCTTSCGFRLPRKTEATAARLIKHLGCKFAKSLRLVVMRKKRKSPASKVSLLPQGDLSRDHANKQ